VWATGIEDTFVAQTGPRARRLDEYELVQHYRFWRQDIDFAAAIGFEVMRYGIPWYLVEPEAGRFDWEWTDQVVPYIAQAGIEPIIDLVHYGTPLWLDRQFCHPDYPKRVAAYADAFATRYRQLVRCYTPVNEPGVTALVCGMLGRWPPALRGDGGFVSICNALSRGIVQTAEAIKAVREDAIIVHVEGTGFWVTEADASTEPATLESERLVTTLELLLGRVEHGHPLYGYLTANGLTDDDLDWFADNRVEIDVLGINYYPDGSVHRRHPSAPEGIVPYWGGTEFLSRAIREFSARYDIPLLVSECAVNERSDATFGLLGEAGEGRSESALREWWLEEVARCLPLLAAEGLPLVGFTWWPLLDTVSWAYREGTGPVSDYLESGGLCALRMDHQGSLHREALPVADRMRDVIAGWK
jgi:beta-glucosidase